MRTDLVLPLRIAQGVVAVVILSLSASVASWYDRDTLSASPAQIDFLVFVPIWTLLSLAYLEVSPRYLRQASYPYLHLVFEGLNVLFYFAGFIALSVFLGKLIFCRGSICAAARADAVFAAFSWVLWCASAAIVGTKVFMREVGRAKADDKTGVIRETTMPSERV